MKLLSDSTTRLSAFYKENKKYQPIVAFFAGFTWDSLTLNRIDLLLDNVIMFTYLILAGLCIILIQFTGKKIIQSTLILKYEEWYSNLLQFFMGGLFSGYIIYYFQSTAVTKNWLFLLLLFLLFVSNEFLKNRLNNVLFQLIFYYLAAFSFFIFYLPVLLKTFSTLVFMLSGFISLFFVAGIIYLFYKKMPPGSFLSLKNTIIVFTSIFAVVNFLYFTNIIPPVPLSLKEGGIYHHVNREGESYKLKFETAAWYDFFKDSESDFHYSPGDTVFCFVSVFAPTDLQTQIYHHWQVFNEKQDTWVTTDRRSYKINGGRDGGYRGFTFKKNVSVGSWRVQVETEREQVLGRIPFEILARGGQSPI